MSAITRFQINKLHGYKNFDLQFEDNTLILVGENGAGKTTVLRLLYYLLSGQWSTIAQFEFERLIIDINNKEHVLPYTLIRDNIKFLDKHLLRRIPPNVRRRFMKLLEHSEGRFDLPELEALCTHYHIPIHYVLQEFDILEEPKNKESKKLKRTLQEIRDSLNAQLLYLPTYRRIEQELSLILKGFDESDFGPRRLYLRERKVHNDYIELIEFGMKDVESAIGDTLEKLKEFARENLNNLTLGYLGDVVEQKYSKVNVKQIKETTDETIYNILRRIHEHILSPENKKHLSEIIRSVKQGETPNDHTKVICHYFIKLLDFQQELQEKESQMRSFCNVCNKYMVDKTFVYDSATFKFTINTEPSNGNPREVELRHLSSGEKQIVSLFSHLYLSGNKNFFVLIDEPELSLSVPWQRMFLMDIKSGDFCSGLVAVTHSPFIYDNDLKRYAHGLGEFSV